MIRLNRRQILLSIGLIIVTLFVSHNFIENYRLKQILDVVQQTESVMNKYNEGFAAAFKAPKNCLFAGSDTSRKYCGLEFDNWVRYYAVPSAEALRNELMVGDFNLERVSIFPLRGDYKLAKEKYHAHLQAWINYATDIATCKNYLCFYNQSYKLNNVTPTFEIAKKLFQEVVPTPNYFGNQKKVDMIFKD